MPPLPKKKHSKTRTRNKRAHIRATVPHLMLCPQCRSPKPNHVACPVCGTYRGREIVHGHEPHQPAPRPTR